MCVVMEKWPKGRKKAVAKVKSSKIVSRKVVVGLSPTEGNNSWLELSEVKYG
jgi:hypothetical protein